MLHTTPIHSDDEPFLFQVYASTRAAEMQSWGWDPAMQQSFLTMQWNAQHRSYAMQYLFADHSIIWLDDQRVGRLLVSRSEQQIVLVDLSLLPEFHNRGIGSALFQELQTEAALAGLPLRLSVLSTNPARRLYERLGFITIGENGVYHNMEWRAATLEAAPSDITS